MHPVHIYQILNHYTSRAELDPGFEVLDNSSNERPDWFEYWPIRRFLLDAGARRGGILRIFVAEISPKDQLDRGLSARVHRPSRRLDGCVPVQSEHSQQRLFSQRIRTRRFASTRGSRRSRRDSSRASTPALRSTISCPIRRNTVHSNYFIAKPRFWRAWLAINERLFAIAESPDDALGEELRAPTSYRGRDEVQMKIFIMERIATWILIRDRKLRGACARPLRGAGAHLQAADGHRVRCAEDRLRDRGARPVQGCLSAREPCAASLEFSDQAGRC